MQETRICVICPGKTTKMTMKSTLEKGPSLDYRGFDMSNNQEAGCSSSKCRVWCFVFAILHLLVLTCIAASLWNIDDAILASGAAG
tara:strand:- start:237 stop:494 length:258 start_codon:yes stop_codon:yes gene_type:complete